MAADTFSSLLGVLLMGTGNDNNSWGINANSSIFQIFEDSIAGMLSSTVTGGTLDLSTPAPPSAASLVRYQILAFSGTPATTQTVIVPALTKTWLVFNNCTTDIYMKTPGGTAITIPVGTQKVIYCGGANSNRLDYNDIGKVEMFAGPTVPPGSLECDNSLRLRASFPELFAKIGTTFGNTDSTNFRLPPGTDTGRFPRSRKAGTDDVGTTYSNQIGTHTHTGSVSITGSTSSDGSHAHSASSSDAGHVHGGGQASGQNGVNDAGGGNFQGAFGSGGGNIWFGAAGSTSTGFASISTTVSAAGTHSHTITGSGSFTTASAGGSETRPESTVYRFCIRY